MKRIILFLSFLMILTACNTTNTRTGSTTDVATPDFVKIPLSSVSDQMIKHSFDAEGVQVNYFIVKGADGQVRTAFDACDVCGGHLGYHQEGSDVVCDKCGRFFNIDDIGSKNTGGGCWPSYLGHKIEGDNVLISKTELNEGKWRFA